MYAVGSLNVSLAKVAIFIDLPWDGCIISSPTAILEVL